MMYFYNRIHFTGGCNAVFTLKAVWWIFEILNRVFNFTKACFVYWVYKQRQKSGGCIYCKNNATIGYDGANDAASIEGDGSVYILSCDSWEIAISYCPMCGIHLRDRNRV